MNGLACPVVCLVAGHIRVHNCNDHRISKSVQDRCEGREPRPQDETRARKLQAFVAKSDSNDAPDPDPECAKSTPPRRLAELPLNTVLCNQGERRKQGFRRNIDDERAACAIRPEQRGQQRGNVVRGARNEAKPSARSARIKRERPTKRMKAAFALTSMPTSHPSLTMAPPEPASDVESRAVAVLAEKVATLATAGNWKRKSQNKTTT